MACVNLDAFPLQLMLIRRPEWSAHPVAVVDRDTAQGVVLWVNETARHYRILPGMRYASALSLSSALRAGVISDTDIEKSVEKLSAKLQFFTSDVEPSTHEAGVFWLDASGLSLLYPSLKKWATLIHTDLAEAGFRTSVTVGFSRFGSYAVAKTYSGIHVFDNPADEKKKAAAVPIERLGFDPKLRDALTKLGITTLGQFLKLPEPSVRKRFGMEVSRLHKLANGELWSPLQPDIPEDPVDNQVYLDHPETNLDRLMALIEQLLTPMLAELKKRDELLTFLTLKFVFDNRSTHSDRLEPASPTLGRSQILELVRLRLEKLPLSSGVAELVLKADSARAERKQRDFFEKESPRDLRAGNRAIARIRAELGEHTVLRARLRDGHLPEARFEWEPIKKVPTPVPRKIATRPLIRRIYRKPVVLSRTRHREPKVALAYMYEDRLIDESVGPYLVTGGWWIREVQREYYFVRTEGGRWLWMFYDRRRKCWYLQGEVE